jgi:hypothetical protein
MYVLSVGKGINLEVIFGFYSFGVVRDKLG